MKALSIQQPWAWLIVHGYKCVENRSWATTIRGAIAIHAGKRFERAGWEWVRVHFPHVPMPRPGQFDAGGIVGTARLVDCITDRSDAAQGNPWFCGPYGFLLEDAKPCDLIRCPGRLGFFEVPA